MVRVLIVVKVRLYREGLASVLGRATGLLVVGAFGDGHEACQQVRALQPDVIMVDTTILHNHTFARDLRQHAPRLPIVALGVRWWDAELLSSRGESVGAAYTTRDASLEELSEAIRRAARGEVTRSAESESRRNTSAGAGSHGGTLKARLTPREREIATLLERHMSNKEIASVLGVEVATVKNHVHNLLEKLSVHRRMDVVRMLTRAGR